jgi:uncharacterized protein YqeY
MQKARKSYGVWQVSVGRRVPCQIKKNNEAEQGANASNKATKTSVSMKVEYHCESECLPRDKLLNRFEHYNGHAPGKQDAMTDAGALETLITQQVVTAMKAHDAVRTTTLRLIKNALKNKAIEKRAPLTPAEEQQALATMIKQRRDSIDQFTKGNRPELAAAEAAEISLIEEFLPKALDESALQALVTEAVAEVTAASGQKPLPKDMGTVMKAVQARLQAASLRAEGRVVSELVKKVLAS